jgi:hypothetical protein
LEFANFILSSGHSPAGNSTISPTNAARSIKSGASIPQHALALMEIAQV